MFELGLLIAGAILIVGGCVCREIKLLRKMLERGVFDVARDAAEIEKQKRGGE